MTTIIGINAGYQNQGIVLASDLAGTTSDWATQGDIAIRRQRKSDVQKIYVSDNEAVALASSGRMDEHYIQLLTDILDGKIDVLQAIGKKFFQEFAFMHLDRWNGMAPVDESMNDLLILTRTDEPKLFYCYPMGKVEEIKSFYSIGSGSKYAREYIASQPVLIPGRCSLDKAVEIAVEGLQRASQDIYTGGFDLVVATKDGIFPYGESIRNEVEAAKTRKIQEIKDKYSPKP